MDSILNEALSRHRNRPLLIDAAGSMSYGEAHGAARAIGADLLRDGPEPPVCAILLPNGAAHFLTLLAIGISGSTRVSLNVRDTVEGYRHRLLASGAEVLVTTESIIRELEANNALSGMRVRRVLVVQPDGDPSDMRIVARDASDGVWPLAPWPTDRPYQLAFTGGTTGEPKAVLLSARAIRANIANLRLDVKNPRQGDVFLAATPLSHASGAFVLPFVLGGAALAWLEHFSAEAFLDDVDNGYLCRQRVTSFVVPTMLDELVRVAADGTWHRDTTTWFDTLIYGAAPAWPGLIKKAVDLFGDHLLQVYGQTEAPMTICVLSPDDQHLFGSGRGTPVGRPCALVSVWVERDGVEQSPGAIGEVCVAGDHVMGGYLGHPEETSEKMAGPARVRTSDLGYFDEDGVLWLVDRSRDMIVSGGYNVYPASVEHAVREAHGVRDVIVSGAPHPKWGEAVVVGIVTDADVEWSTVVGRVHDVCASALAGYERPKAVVLLETIPVTPLGKPDRRAFRDEVADTFEAADMWVAESSSSEEDA